MQVPGHSGVASVVVVGSGVVVVVVVVGLVVRRGLNGEGILLLF